MFVKDYMIKSICTAKEDITVAEAVKIMVEKKTNSLIVIDNNEKPIGMISSFTLIKAVVPEYLKNDPVSSNFDSEGTFDKYAEKTKDIKISSLMHRKFHVLGENDTMIEAAAYSISDERRMLPVVNKESGKVVGAISRTGIKNALYKALFKDSKDVLAEDREKYNKTY